MLSLPFAIDWLKALARFFLGQFVATHSPAQSTLDTAPLTGHCRSKRRCVSITASPQLRGDSNRSGYRRFPVPWRPFVFEKVRVSQTSSKVRSRPYRSRIFSWLGPWNIVQRSFFLSFHANNGPGEDNVSRRKVLTPISGLAEEMAHDTSSMAAQRQGPNPRNISAAYRMGEDMITCTIHQAELISAW